MYCSAFRGLRAVLNIQDSFCTTFVQPYLSFKGDDMRKITEKEARESYQARLLSETSHDLTSEQMKKGKENRRKARAFAEKANKKRHE